MADLALGLAKSTVDGTLSLVKAAIKEEDDLQKSVKRDLLLITDEFEMMRSFLNDTKEHVSSNMARTMVRQVRDMSLDVEDCVEYVVQYTDKSSWLHRLLPRWQCLPTARPVICLDDAVENIELLKARVESMGQRKMRYNHVGESAPKAAEQTHQQALAITAAPHVPVKSSDTTRRLKSQVNLVKLINSAEAKKDKVEKKEDKIEEEQQIKEGDKAEEEKNGDKVEEEGKVQAEVEEQQDKEQNRELQVISVLATRNDDVVSMSIKKTYDDHQTSKGFTCRAWVKLMHPFDPYVFMHSLLAEFYSSYDEKDDTMDIMELEELMAQTGSALIGKFKKHLKRKYLVVLEDVSSMVDWKDAKAYLPDYKNGSCIIVHTQQTRIAAMSVGHLHQVSELENTEHPVYVVYRTDKENVLESTNKTKAAKEKAASDWLNKFTSVCHQESLTRIDNIVNWWRCKIAFVFSVWGVPGVGKSTLVKRAYNTSIKQGEYSNFGWVDVSYPFNLKDLLWSLLVDLQSESSLSILGIKDPIQGCRQFLQENKCLIVIDGLQSTDEWDLIRNAIAHGKTKSSIIVITSEERIATYCRVHEDCCYSLSPLKVECLEVQHALDLWRHEVHKEDFGSIDMTQAKLMLQKCGGLPKLIISVTDFVFDYNRAFLELRSNNLSDRFVDVLEEVDGENLRDLFAWMHSYLRSCPDSLKPCLFYLSVFPVQRIRRRRLLRRWIAEGYSRDTDEEETAEKLFTQLEKMDIIQVTRWQLIYAAPLVTSLCQVNGFIREYMKSRAMEEDLVFALEGPRSMKLKPTGRHLTIGTAWKRDKDVFESIDLYRLRSLTVSGEWKPYLISKKMRVLRVLDLEDALGVNDDDVEKMVMWLPRLWFLSVRGCREVERLPDLSLGGLTLLQTLDIRDTSISELPKSIAKLQKLQYIRAGTTVPLNDDTAAAAAAAAESVPLNDDTTAAAAAESSSLVMVARSRCCSLLSRFRKIKHGSHNGGVKVPREIFREHSDMHTLGVVNISGSYNFEGLKFPSRLHKLGVSGINGRNSKKVFAAISILKHLTSLSVQLDKDNQDDCFVDTDPPPKSLRRLKLYGLECKLPAWFDYEVLPLLKKLSLQVTNMPPEGYLHICGEQRYIDILRLCLTGGGDFCFHEDEAIKPMVIDIACNSRLQSVRFSEKNSTYVLKIRCYGVSESLKFSGSLNVKEVWLSGTYEDAFKEHLKSEIDQCSDPKPVLKLLEEPHY